MVLFGQVLDGAEAERRRAGAGAASTTTRCSTRRWPSPPGPPPAPRRWRRGQATLAAMAGVTAHEDAVERELDPQVWSTRPALVRRAPGRPAVAGQPAVVARSGRRRARAIARPSEVGQGQQVQEGVEQVDGRAQPEDPGEAAGQRAEADEGAGEDRTGGGAGGGDAHGHVRRGRRARPGGDPAQEREGHAVDPVAGQAGDDGVGQLVGEERAGDHGQHQDEAAPRAPGQRRRRPAPPRSRPAGRARRRRARRRCGRGARASGCVWRRWPGWSTAPP